MVIIINGRTLEIKAITLSFEDIFCFAFPHKISEMNYYTITYRNGVLQKPAGTMAPGDTVAVQSGMIFNVANCSNS